MQSIDPISPNRMEALVKEVYLEQVFSDMELQFIKAEVSKHNHWKIPGEDHIIRIATRPAGGTHTFLTEIFISQSKGRHPECYNPDSGIVAIQDIIENKFEDAYAKLFCPHSVAYNIMHEGLWRLYKQI